MAGNRDPQRRPVLYDLKNQRFLADPAIGSTYYPINLGGGGTYLTPADIGVSVQGYDATLLNAADIGVSVQGYDATLLKAADIGVTVQGYDATLLNAADIGVSVQGYDATLLKAADIGVTVQGYDVDTAKLDVAQSFTAQQTFRELKETTATLAGTSIDPASGSILTKVLTGSITFTEALESGQCVVLMLENGSSHAVTWPTMTWVSSGGNLAPTLTDKDVIVLWKISTTLYGSHVGSYL